MQAISEEIIPDISNYDPDDAVLYSFTTDARTCVGAAVVNSPEQLVGLFLSTGIPYDQDALEPFCKKGGQALVIVTPPFTDGAYHFTGCELTSSYVSEAVKDSPYCLELQLKFFSAAEQQDLGIDEERHDDSDDTPCQHVIIVSLPPGVSRANVFLVYPDQDEPDDDAPLDEIPSIHLQQNGPPQPPTPRAQAYSGSLN